MFEGDELSGETMVKEKTSTERVGYLFKIVRCVEDKLGESLDVAPHKVHS